MDASRQHSPAEVSAFLRECLHGEPGEVLRRVPGRVTFAVRGPNGAPWVVKRFRGSWFGKSPAEREHQALEALRREGLPVPLAVGYVEGYGSALVGMERVEAEGDLRSRLSELAPAELKPLTAQLLELVLALHTRGWHHRDLYLHHVLIDAGGGLVLIDLGRARRPRWVRRRWFAKDLAALLLWTPPEVGVRHRLRFLAKYMDAMEITSRRARRRFAEDVARRRARMALHVPRHGETGPWEVPS